MPKFFRFPWATTGDKTAVPDLTDPTGLVNYQTGYTVDYQRDPATDPLAKYIERDKLNQVLYDITENVRSWQTDTFPEFITSAQNGGVAYAYKEGATVRYDDGSGYKTYRSTIDGNTELPTGAGWIVFSGGVSVNTIDDLRLMDGASFGSVNLLGYYEQGDGGGGQFYWDAASTETEVSGMIVAVTGVATGRWKRLYSGAVNVKWFGATGDGATDDTASFQSAITYARTLVRADVFVPSGDYIITSTLDFTRTTASQSKVSMRGEDTASSRIHFNANGNLIYIGVTETVTDYTSYQVFEKMSLLGNGAYTSQTAIQTLVTQHIKFSDIRIEGFTDGIIANDMDHSRFYNITIRFCTRGATFYKKISPTLSVAPTQANNIIWSGFHIGANTEYGARIRGGALVTFIGGSFERNGSGSASGYGLKYEDCGFEGAVGASCYGVYFENNYGLADLFIQAIDPIPNGFTAPIIQAVHNVSGCSFTRVLATAAPNNIRVDFNDPAVSGKQVLNVIGSGFKSAADYVPSASNKYIAFVNYAATPWNYFVSGCMMEDNVETPFNQSPNKSYGRFYKATSQTIPTNTATLWAFDTIGSRFGFTSAAFTTNGQIVIPETGFYTISAYAPYTLAVTSGSLTLRLGTTSTSTALARVSFGGETSASLSVTALLNAGEIITLWLYHASGADRTLAGADTSRSEVIINKSFDKML